VIRVYTYPIFCPKCLKELHEVFISLSKRHHASHGETIRLLVDQCFSCNGIWFDGNEFEKYLEYDLVILNSPPINPEQFRELDETEGNCPRCDIKTDKEPAKSNPGVKIDKCRQCGGIWLDCSEIDQLENTDENMVDKFMGILQGLFR